MESVNQIVTNYQVTGSHCRIQYWYHSRPFPHDDIMTWQQFLDYWPFVLGIHRSSLTVINNVELKKFSCLVTSCWTIIKLSVISNAKMLVSYHYNVCVITHVTFHYCNLSIVGLSIQANFYCHVILSHDPCDKYDRMGWSYIIAHKKCYIWLQKCTDNSFSETVTKAMFYFPVVVGWFLSIIATGRREVYLDIYVHGTQNSGKKIICKIKESIEGKVLNYSSMS